MSEREELAYRAALMHYVQGQTMDSIARKLAISRSTVSRLVELARKRGYIQFQAYPPAGHAAELREKIAERFGVTTHVVPIGQDAQRKGRLDAVASIAGAYISSVVTSDAVVGIAWGNTLSAIAEHLVPKPLSGVLVVELNGAANVGDSDVLYPGAILEAFGAAYRAHVQHFPVPAFFDYPETKVALWRERSVRQILNLQKEVNVAVFSVGTFAGVNPSLVYSQGYLTNDTLAELRELGAVGDVCTVVLRADGTWEDLDVNRRASGLTPRELAKIPRRICVVSGVEKAPALLAALQAGVATDLVIDEDCAAQLLKLSDGAA